ncbi:MAG: hypothetical protein AAF720_01455 [Pseudomonadota bacterium]
MDRREFLKNIALLSTGASLVGCVNTRSPLSTQPLQVDPAEEDVLATMFEQLTNSGGAELECLTCSPIGSKKRGRAELSEGEEYRTRIPKLDSSLSETLKQRVKYWQLDLDDKPLPYWADNQNQPDYYFFSKHYSNEYEKFELNNDVLKVLAERNSFAFADVRDVRIIGLRGCELDDQSLMSDWQLSHRLRVVKPDHKNRRCLIGVWRPQSGEIRLFSASTVPQASNMFASLASQGSTCSLLPTGLYRYRLGIHNAKRRPQPGALRIDEKYVVLRTTTDLKYDVFSKHDYWTRGSYHNIHSATNGVGAIKFDSSGCQVIRGSYNSARTLGTNEWAIFQKSAGLVSDDGTAFAAEKPGEGTYEYMLLTAAEAALAYHSSSDFNETYYPLRHGSSGERVLKMREFLYSNHPVVVGKKPPRPTDNFDWWTSFAVLQQHKISDAKEYISTIWNT